MKRFHGDEERFVLALYIINGRTGRILFNNFITEIDFQFKINLVVDDNGVFVTYYTPIVILYFILQNNILNFINIFAY